MSWNGWFTLDGQEFINAPRTEAYAEAAGAFWIKSLYKNDDLAPMLGETPYTTPLLDNAPWTDPDIPESYDFFGLYPLDVDGIENSSRQSSPIEYTIDGGTAGRIRHASKSVVFNAALVGANEKAVVYGASWLRRVLLGDRCNNPTLDHGIGTDLEYLSAEPRMDDNPATDPTQTLEPLRRTLRRFVVNEGPSVTTRRVIQSCGGAVWTVTFTGVAGVPWQFGAERPVLQGYLDPVVTDPWVPGVTPGTITTGEFRETPCGEDTWEPLYDPLCPALVVPPAPPSIPLGCFELPKGNETVLATNLATNPSVETDATNWTQVATAWTGARMGPLTDSEIGEYVYRTTVNTVPTSTTQWALQVHTGGARIPATPGELCGIRIRFRGKPGMAVRSLQLRIRAYNGTTAGPNTGFGTANITTSDDWQEAVVNGVLPAGNDGFSLNVSPSTPAEWNVGDYVEWDGFQPWKITDPGPDSYFDGDTPDDENFTYEWTGADHASTSTMTGVDPEWDRRTVVIPESVVPLWGTVSPVVTLYAPEDVRGTRLRFYADPDGTLDPTATPCAYEVDLVVSYIPAEGTLIFDSASQQVWVLTVNGQRRRADSLVFTTEGEPFEWPELTCGYQHLLTVDTAAGSNPPYLDLSLIPKVL